MWTLASDVDGTLTGDRDALDRLAARLCNSRAQGNLFLILSTGRRLAQVLEGLAEEGLPDPDAVVCQVGTEIYPSPLSEDSRPMPAWRERLLAEYSREEALSFLEGIEGLALQPEVFNTELKTSCFLDECPDPEGAAAEIRRRVLPHADRYQVVWSSAADLDILPASSGKGKAIRFLVELRDLDPQRVVVAGDTGSGYVTLTYRCEGDTLLLLPNTLIGVGSESSGNLALGDYDGDGDLDLALAGMSASGRVARIYANDGDGGFTWDTSQSLTGVSDASLAWGDVDQDGDLDLLLAGDDGEMRITTLYENDPLGTLAVDAGTALTGLAGGAAAWRIGTATETSTCS